LWRVPPFAAYFQGERMTLTLLFDLDDTLLDANMDEFIPAYFHALGKAMSPYVASEEMLKHLMVGTNAMVSHDSPDETLQDVFERDFYPHFDTGRDILDPAIAQFYAEIFPTLAYLTKPRPEAVDLVEWAFAQGHRVAISTNPLFPRAAIDHRLRWAGLAPEKYPFEVISSFESFHFSKPNPAYLAEVLGQMGWPEGPVLVVGDDEVRDMLAAEELGLAMYWIADEDAQIPEGRAPIAGRGSIGGVRSWIESLDKEMLLPRYQAKTSIVATTKAVPAILKQLLKDIPNEKWIYSANPDEWNITEILGHLRDVEREVNLPRIQTFLHEENPFITADDTDLWVAERGYAQKDGEAILHDFIATRLDTIAALEGLSEFDWQRSGRHAIFGPITLQEQLGFTAEHDRVHIRQVYNTLKKRKK
jgi:FMN phosphatase YigB (HAD superfamily)